MTSSAERPTTVRIYRNLNVAMGLDGLSGRTTRVSPSFSPTTKVRALFYRTAKAAEMTREIATPYLVDREGKRLPWRDGAEYLAFKREGHLEAEVKGHGCFVCEGDLRNRTACFTATV